MAAVGNLLFTLIVFCLMKRGHSVTDEEFRGFSVRVMDSMDVMKQTMQVQQSFIIKLQEENERQAHEIQRLNEIVEKMYENPGLRMDEVQGDVSQNGTVEERVTLLEIQMDEVQGDVSQNQGDISLLFNQQVIQDERLVDLEDDTSNLEQSVENVQVNTLELEQRLNVFEENVNSSVVELQARVDALEETDTDHESRLTATETVLEELDERISALEEIEETFAFHAVVTSFPNMTFGETVVFNEVLVNDGNGYENNTGVFTVSPGGEGLYYFSTYLTSDELEYSDFFLTVNDQTVCVALGDDSNGGFNIGGQMFCSAVVYAYEGDEVKVTYAAGIDNSPLWDIQYYHNGFNGFRL